MPNLKRLTLFVFFFALACETVFIKTPSIESRRITGPENILFADACIHFTCFGSEGVKERAIHQDKTQHANFQGMPLFQATKQHSTVKW